MHERVVSFAQPSQHGSVKRRSPTRRPLTLDALWHSRGVRALLYQVLVIVAVIGVAAYLINNAQDAMAQRGIATGFGFLTEEAGFAIGEHMIAYDSSDSYLRAYAVAILNTLKVSAFSVIAASVLGVLIGIARLSENWLVSRTSSLYVEVFRNTPQLVQIVFWYTLITRLPHPKQALDISNVAFFSNRGVIVPWPSDSATFAWMAVALVVGMAAAWAVFRWADRRRRTTGQMPRILGWNIALICLPPMLIWLASGAPTAMSIPELRGFNFVGGIALSPEFIALLLGLSLYIAAFIAEIVRAGVQAVDRGQIEASRAIGLKPRDRFLKIVLPQALRVIIPPTAAQYVSLAKNSSLGVAIGYPELFNVNNTITTTSGNTVECIGIMMAVYLSIAFVIAALMNLYNAAVQISER